MSIKFRHYCGKQDNELISQFLIEHYQVDNKDGNWLQPAWEYMHSHSYLDKSSLGKIGIWEEADNIVAVAHYESRLGEAFFQFRPSYGHLKKEEVLSYAEENLYSTLKNGKKYVQAFVNDFDQDFVSLVKVMGYQKDHDGRRPLYIYEIPDPLPHIALPSGFQLKSLAEDCDWVKIHRVLWRGFDHPGEPPAEDIEERRSMQDTPNFRHDLKIVVEAPNGDFASYCGMWYEPTNRYAYVEPVATDPDYRRMGLGKAAVLEGIRRCAALDATVAYVGSDLEFYKSMGFKKVFISECWMKQLDK